MRGCILVLCLMQQNKGVDKRTEHTPEMSDNVIPLHLLQDGRDTTNSPQEHDPSCLAQRTNYSS